MDKDINELKQGLTKYGRNDLREVQADAKFNYLTRLKEQQDKAAYEAAKAQGYDAVSKLADERIAEFKSEPVSKKGK